MSTTTSVLAAALDRISRGDSKVEYDCAAALWREALPVMAPYLRRAMEFDRIERVEAILKRYLQLAFAAGVSGDDARFLAEWSKGVGFILKFKPYGVKCATPLGYSVFFLRPGMGFSFQRHLTRKTELFHILKVLEGGQVYLSTSDEWKSVYDRAAFDRWLNGSPDSRYERFAIRPKPGDVYLVTELETVHTVLGCVLEEFATVSVDLVDRLHDQNVGRDESHIMAREVIDAWLADLPRHMPRTCLSKVADGPQPIVAEDRGDYSFASLSDTDDFVAEHYELKPGRKVRLEAQAVEARNLFVLGGRCRVELRGPDEPDLQDVAGVELSGGHVIIVPPGIRVALKADEPTALSCHGIRPELALG